MKGVLLFGSLLFVLIFLLLIIFDRLPYKVGGQSSKHVLCFQNHIRCRIHCWRHCLLPFNGGALLC